jgi:colicin import membrane protein
MTELRFTNYVYISIAGHIAIALMIFFKAVLAPSEHIDLRDAIRVDIVGLPKKQEALPEKEAPAPPRAELPKPKEAEKPKAPEAPAPKKTPDTKKAEQRALEKLKAMAALEKIKEDVNKEKTPKPQQVAGNQVSQGNALTGLTRIEYDRYLAELKSKVYSAWSLPPWLAEQDLRSQILVLIDERGYVIKKIFKKSSGNEVFDAKVIEAIDTSTPLPPPPAQLRGLLSTSGITFNFPQ